MAREIRSKWIRHETPGKCSDKKYKSQLKCRCGKVFTANNANREFCDRCKAINDGR